MTNEKPITVHDAEFHLLRNAHSCAPEFSGRVSELHLATAQGMPKHFTIMEKAAIFRAIKTGTTIIYEDAVRTATVKAVVWHPPIHACSAMATTLIDRQLPPNDIDRHVRIILRALPTFHNKNSIADVKVAVEYDMGIKIHFAKCLLFLKDSHEEYYVVVQWYDPVGREPFDPISGLPQLQLRPPGITKSYSVMPVTSIINGAIITRTENKYWVLLSPRESLAYEMTNSPI
jgi:hypothetical protein